MPDPDTITLGTDITGFMRKEIPELLRRKALRALWKSNPVLAVLDGLNDYDEDYTDAATAGEAVKTLYKVGQGMFDKTATKTEPTIEHAEPQTGEPEPVNTRETSPPEGLRNQSQPLTLQASPGNHHRCRTRRMKRQNRPHVTGQE